jgi:alkylation response protein AidB-like acyl-CoA dehydrogenase
MAIVMEELGRACDPTPFSDCVLGCGWLIQDLGDAAQHQRWLVPLIGGELQAALAALEAGGDWSARPMHHHADTNVLRLAARRAQALRRERARSRPCCWWRPVTAHRGSCASRWYRHALPASNARPCARWRTPDLHEVRFTAVGVAQADLLGGDDIGAALDAALLRTAVFQSAAAVGGARRVLELATQHVRQRVQFGRPIGSFQAVQHLLANVWIDVEAAWLAAYEGITELERSPRAIDRACAAKCISNEAFTRACFTAHQVLGGMGFMWETDLHLWTRKAKEIELACGGLPYHRALLAAALG